jgi:hypothetical protein
MTGNQRNHLDFEIIISSCGKRECALFGCVPSNLKIQRARTQKERQFSGHAAPRNTKTIRCQVYVCVSDDVVSHSVEINHDFKYFLRSHERVRRALSVDHPGR